MTGDVVMLARSAAAGASADCGPRLLIACMPKSGSTYLSNVLRELTRQPKLDLVPHYGAREQELSEEILRGLGSQGFVAQHHVRSSGATRDLCARYAVCPIVLIRGLFDVVVSLRDHVGNESPHMSMMFLGKRHRNIDTRQLELMLSELAVPWYINFYMGWRETRGAIVVSYEELVAKPVSTIARVTREAGLTFSAAQIEAAIAAVKAENRSRLNSGVAGRGDQLQPAVKEAIWRKLELYPEAAGDPYFLVMKTQLERSAAQQGAASASRYPRSLHRTPRLIERASRALAQWRWRRRYAGRLLSGRGRIMLRSAAMIIVIVYLNWSNDLINDDVHFGMLDDSFVALAGAMMFLVS